MLLFMSIILKHRQNDRSIQFKRLLKINIESDTFNINCINKQLSKNVMKSG